MVLNFAKNNDIPTSQVRVPTYIISYNGHHCVSSNLLQLIVEI